MLGSESAITIIGDAERVMLHGRDTDVKSKDNRFCVFAVSDECVMELDGEKGTLALIAAAV